MIDKTNPAVTVIIPLYNKGSYILRALESVFCQTWRDYEVIVVDDGSTDNGPELVRGCSDRRLRFISQVNSGPGSARNLGVLHSRGRYVAFLDADDEWMPRYLEKSLSVLAANPDCELSACSYFLGEEKFDVTPLLEKRGIRAGAWEMTKDISNTELKHCFEILYCSTVVCERGVIERYGGFRSKAGCDYGEDLYLWLQVMFNHRVYRILEPLHWYHSEASELGPGRSGGHPLQAFLTDPEPIRRNCRVENRQLLERFFAGFALATAHECAFGGDIGKVSYLIDSFPGMKRYRWEYAKLKLKQKVPALIPVVRCIKRAGVLR